MDSIGNLLARISAWLNEQSDMRRAAVLGMGFGLLACVILTLACLAGSWIVQ